MDHHAIEIGKHIFNLREWEVDSCVYITMFEGKQVEITSTIMSLQYLVGCIMSHFSLPHDLMVSLPPNVMGASMNFVSFDLCSTFVDHAIVHHVHAIGSS